jgi:hypothetical protein
MMEKREDEFQNLRQGGMFVAQYATKFNRLSKYCDQLVDTKQNRIRQFIKRLRPELRRALILFLPSNYSTAVDAATRTKNEDKLRFGNKVTNFGKKFPNKRPFGQQGNNQQKQARTVQRDSNTNEKSYFGCGKKGHLENVYWYKQP